jgi:hypothetical protein
MFSSVMPVSFVKKGSSAYLFQTELHGADLSDDRIRVMRPAPEPLGRARNAKKLAVEHDCRLHD